MSFFDRTDWRNWLPGCGCEPVNVKLVQFEISGNEKRFGLRCEACGKVNGGKPIGTSNLTQQERQDAAARLLNLAESRLAAEASRAIERELMAEDAKQRTAEWWAKYDEYLRSATWAEKRVKVLERDQYLCQACRDRRAVQVHHLTYRHVFNEPLFDLVAVCVTCHELITAIERHQIPREAVA